MRVICIDSGDINCGLDITFGRIYNVVSEEKNYLGEFYRIINDKGSVSTYFKYRFNKIDDSLKVELI